VLQNFHQKTDSISDAKELAVVADSFIRANPYSEVSIHLLREYFVNQLHPDQTRIKTLIGTMSGNMQDNNYIRQLQRMLNARKPLVKNSVVTNYNVHDSEGKNVSTSDYKDTYLLITFWASWDEESRQRQRELIALKESTKRTILTFSAYRLIPIVPLGYKLSMRIRSLGVRHVILTDGLQES
jgi:hypothetical protein